MTILYFGIYNPDYPRNRLLIRGLRANGIDVLECNERGQGFVKYLKLMSRHLFLRHKYDIMLVGFPGHSVMRLARLLTKKPIVFDAFLSLYDSEVYDRKLVLPHSRQAQTLLKQDQEACRQADLNLVDTREHLEYFANFFSLSKEKFRIIPVGADDNLFFPKPKISQTFIVHFHGKYIPLQGIEYIVGAAEILRYQSIQFRILGRGQEYQRITDLINSKHLKNIEQVDMVPYQQLPDYINDSDICLGIFGNSEKTLRVIPNKVAEYLACGKAVITADSPGARELLADGVNVRFSRAGDSQDLAAKIMELYQNQGIRKILGSNARKLYSDKLTPKILGARLITYFNDLLKKS